MGRVKASHATVALLPAASTTAHASESAAKLAPVVLGQRWAGLRAPVPRGLTREDDDRPWQHRGSLSRLLSTLLHAAAAPDARSTCDTQRPWPRFAALTAPPCLLFLVVFFLTQRQPI